MERFCQLKFKMFEWLLGLVVRRVSHWNIAFSLFWLTQQNGSKNLPGYYNLLQKAPENRLFHNLTSSIMIFFMTAVFIQSINIIWEIFFCEIFIYWLSYLSSCICTSTLTHASKFVLMSKQTRFSKSAFKRTEKLLKSRKTEGVSLTTVSLGCGQKTMKFWLFYVCKRMFQHFRSKDVCECIKKKHKRWLFFHTRELPSWSWFEVPVDVVLGGLKISNFFLCRRRRLEIFCFSALVTKFLKNPL